MRIRIAAPLILTLALTVTATAQPSPNAGPDGLRGLCRIQDFQARRESSAHEDLHSNGDARSVAKGETIVLGDLEGPGMITHIWTTVGSEDPFWGRSLVIRMYWDGAAKPSVEVPLADFFGVGHGAAADFTSLPVSTSSHGRAKSCFWNMPFRKSARVTLTNESEQYDTDSFYYYLDWEKHPELPDDIAYFHAQYRQAMPATPGDYTILETTGKGHYVGTVQSVQQVELGWFGEGDDRFYIDGEETPSLRGTGTEDYFGDAWGFRAFATPFYGVSLWEGYFPGDRGTAYRWHIADPIPFTKSLKVAIEHRGSAFTDMGEHLGQFNERPDWVSSVAFWYQTPPAQFTTPLPTAAKRIAPYRVLPAADLVRRATPAPAVSTDGPTVNLMPLSPDASIEFDFDLEQDGRYQITGLIWHSIFASVYQVSLDGALLGEPLDLYASGHDAVWVSFDLHDLKAGKHTLQFEGVGASPRRRTMAPPAHAFGMTYLCLLRLQDMAGYHEVLNKRLAEKAAK
jgi:D-arabinan exo alpha-(1,3)/(1,5)-arabinofuranosidase (non-reducing end)